MQAKRNIEKIPTKKINPFIEQETPNIVRKKVPSSLTPQERLVERALNMPFPLSADAFQFNLDTPLDEAAHIAVLETYFPKLDDWTIQSEEYEKLAYAIAMLQFKHNDIALNKSSTIPATQPKESAVNIETIVGVDDTTENTFASISALIAKTMIAPITLLGRLL